MKTTARNLSSCRGSALITAIMYSTVLVLIFGSLLSWTMTERRLTYRHATWLEARNAAEAIAEYGISQIYANGRSSNVILSTETANQIMFRSTGSKALQLPGSGLLSSPRLVTNGSSAPEVRAGSLTPYVTAGNASMFFFNGNAINYANDRDVSNRWAQRRDIRIIAKATVTPPGGGSPVTSYVQEVLSVRAVPLFTAAIFYNMDMELSPGPTMNIGGPVVVNGSLYVGGRGANITFQDTVSTSGNIFHALKNKYTLYTLAAAGTSESFMGSNDGNINFKSGAGTTSMKDGSTWNDSTMNVSSTIMSAINSYGTVADYTAALNAAATTNLAAFNAIRTTNGWADYVKTNATRAPLPAIPDYREQSPTATASTDDCDNSGHLIIEPALATTDPHYSADIEAQKFATKAGLTFVVNPSTGDIKAYVGGSDLTGTLVTTALPSGLITYSGYSGPSSYSSGNATNSVTGGLFDQRRNKGVNLVKLDYSKLRTALKKIGTTDSTAIKGLTSAGWTGVVYIKIAGSPTTRVADGGTATTRPGSTIAGTSDALRTGVQIINGANTATDGTPTDGASHPGLTIATNNPIYIKGAFNADGSTTSASITNKDSDLELPASIAADAITVLSSNFSEGNSAKNSGSSTDSAATNEISAAFITGLTPTNKDQSNRSSGGAHNLVRFLEDWGGGARSLYIRGSLCSMYESRVATEPFTLSYYSPPARNWGLNQLFRNGSFPPGIPMTISFRRIGFKELTATEYNAIRTSL